MQRVLLDTYFMMLFEEFTHHTHLFTKYYWNPNN